MILKKIFFKAINTLDKCFYVELAHEYKKYKQKHILDPKQYKRSDIKCKKNFTKLF